MYRIPLTQGQFAIVDYGDFKSVSRWKWYALWSPITQSFYATRTLRAEDGRSRRIYMHREIAQPGGELRVDHKNGDTLDNRRENVRSASHAQNIQNSRKPKSNTSGLKGVSASGKKWLAQITANGKNRYLGVHATREDAHAAYVTASRELHGDFGRTA